MARLIDRLKGHQETLKPLIEAASQDRLAATLLFAGPSGVGKRLAALTLAQALVCERSKTGACGECGPCLRIEKGQSESLMIVEPSGAAIKIEQARDVLQFITLQRLGRSRVIIIDQAHLMGPQAANALLKSLEEPPSGTYFILVTSMAASVLPTIRSRSQLVRFKPLSDHDLRAVLLEQQSEAAQEVAPVITKGKAAKEEPKAAPNSAKEIDAWILKSAHGSVENAKRLLDDRSEFQTLENATVDYLNASLVRFPGEEISALRELLKDRGSHGFVSSVIQGLVRDALKGQNPSLQAIGPRKLEILAQKSIEFESDLGRNVDRGLILETFAVEIAKALRPSAHAERI